MKKDPEEAITAKPCDRVERVDDEEERLDRIADLFSRDQDEDS